MKRGFDLPFADAIPFGDFANRLAEPVPPQKDHALILRQRFEKVPQRFFKLFCCKGILRRGAGKTSDKLLVEFHKLGAAFCGVFAKPEPTLVTVENSIGDYLAGSLARFPYPGEMWYSLHLSSDIHSRESTDGLVYYVEIIFATKEEHINMNKEKTAAECKHLASLGYELYIEEKDWIGYWGEDKHYSTVCGVLSVEQMEALAEVSNYGCYLDFAMGDIENYTRVEAN